MPTHVYWGEIPTVVVPKLPPTQQFQDQPQFQNLQPFPIPQTSQQISAGSEGKWLYMLLGLLAGTVLVLAFFVFSSPRQKYETANATNNSKANKETPTPTETPKETSTPTETPKETTTERTKPTFSYNPYVGKYPEASTRLLNEGDIYGKSNWELRIMRNEIFARRGRRFKDANLRNYFMSQPWYNPQFDEVKLSELEKRNVEFLKAYE